MGEVKKGCEIQTKVLAEATISISVDLDSLEISELQASSIFEVQKAIARKLEEVLFECSDFSASSYRIKVISTNHSSKKTIT